MDPFTRISQQVVDLESVITTAELNRRPSRAPNHEAENRALVAIAQAMTSSPDAILQKLADIVLDLCRAQSAGLSILDKDRKRFRWRAVAGQWASHLGGGTPRDFGPCGTVLDRNAVLLFSHPERHFPYLASTTPWIEEGLLVPFYVNGEAVGTIWAIVHDQSRQFDAEDKRLLESLGNFAATGYQVLDLNYDYRQAVKAREDMIAIVSHDLKNPIGVLVMASQMIQQAIENSAEDITFIKENMGRISRTALFMNKVVNNLTEFAKIQAGSLSIDSQECFVDEVLNPAIETVSPQADKKNIQITRYITDNLPLLFVDTTKIIEVLLNLLGNAVKFTPEHGRIELRVEFVDEQVQFAVGDNGPGIAPEGLTHVFEPYWQARETRSGMGLGLFIAKNFVEAHGGSINVQSTLGRGTTFWFRLPAHQKSIFPLPPPRTAIDVQRQRQNG